MPGEPDNHDTLLDELLHAGVIASPGAHVRTLTGGVSSDILLVDDGQRPVVVKRALARLRVAQEWKADVSRNGYEQAYMRYVGRRFPQTVPRIYHTNPQRGYFVMQYLGRDWTTWKSCLLAQRVEPLHARTAGQTLGCIHHASWNDPAARRTFASDRNFFELRLEPYLLTTARGHRRLAAPIEAEAARIAATHQCLVHGDFSPKNLLVPKGETAIGRMIVLDCEVAWFGDAAFDVAFLLNHLMLKAAHLPPVRRRLLQCVPAAWGAYAAAVGSERADGVQPRVARLLPMLMLARIDGKSPAEYLVDKDVKDRVRRFCFVHINQPPASIAAAVNAWEKALGQD